MIITIKGADFSSANIGTLSTYIISKSIGSGASFDIPNFVDKNSSVNWTITLDEGYTFGTYSVTMGGVEITPTVEDNVMTISIAEVTSNVRIVVATVNENTGEDDPTIPDEPVVPPVDPEEPEEPETPDTGTTLTFANGDAVVVDSVSDMQFTIGNTFAGEPPYKPITNTNGKGRAASVGYVLKVNGGETITLNQPFEGKTIYYSTVSFANNTDTTANQSDQVFTMKKWETVSKVIPSEVKYLFIAFKNGDNVDFTADEIETIKNNFIIS
jgi:hypothetical protein